MDEDELDELTAFDMEVEDLNGEEREWEGDDYKAVCWSYKDIKKLMQETALNDFSSITICAPHANLCFPWLGRGDYTYEKIGGVDMFVSRFPGGQHYNPPNFKEVKMGDEKTLRDRLKDIKPVNKEKIIPKVLKSREEAVEVLKYLNIYNPKLVDALYPRKKEDFLDMTSNMLSYFEKFVGNFDIQSHMIKRANSKFNLPGFQGILDDSFLKAELKSIFGENFYHLLTGNFNLTRRSYDMYKAMILRNYNRCSNSDKSLSIFLLSLLQDCCITIGSDSWFLDVMNDVTFGIDERANPIFQEMIMPVLPQGMQIEYTEKDMFD
ncbi:unknown protein [Pythium polare bunya-like RNA virus 1]|uniref:hypothetical protein n=1 Tax=Pythium polare bunya-like RNA virus 1 TaxID=2137352 RepID=UPI000DF054D9|nr:hypothetical protein EXH61_gp3 [Pythium polare bunya-like RNA virus 1]BBD50446.1 unknown protein [Pythium polare bunya-like RNA virus 1]